MSRNTVYRIGMRGLAAGLLLAWAGLYAGAAEAAGKGQDGVLLVMSEYRPHDPVATRVIALLRKDRLPVKLAVSTSLEGLSPEKYGAIIVMNFIDNGRADRPVRVFGVESVQRRIILFNAVGKDYLGQAGTPLATKNRSAARIALGIREHVNAVLSQGKGKQ